MEPSRESRHWRQQAAEICTAALNAVDPAQAVRSHLHREGDRLQVGERAYNLDDFQRIFVVGGGKAGSPMAAAVADMLGDRLTAGVVNVKHGHTLSHWQVTFGSQLSSQAPQRLSLPATLDIVEAGKRPEAGTETITGWEAELERVFLGVRLRRGVTAPAVAELLVHDFEGAALAAAGKFEVVEGTIRVLDPLFTDAVARVVLDLPSPAGSG